MTNINTTTKRPPLRRAVRRAARRRAVGGPDPAGPGSSYHVSLAPKWVDING